MEWFLFWIGVNFLIGYAIGKPKDQAVSSALICVLLGPIGWIICAVSSGNTRQCPHCAERVKAGAVVCRYCGKELPEVRQPASDALAVMTKAPRTGQVKIPRQVEVAPLPKGVKITLGCLLVVLISVLALILSNRARPALSSKTAPSPTASASETVQMESPSIVSATEKLSQKSSLTTSPSTDFIRLLKPVTVQGAYGAITLQAGTSVPFVSRDGDNVRFHYHNTEYEIPVDTTDLAK
jgi:zinc-ribbon domain